MTALLDDVRPEHEAWLDTWLGGCASLVGYDTVAEEAPSRSLVAAMSDGLRAKIILAAVPVGIVAYRAETPTPNDAIIEFVGIEPARTRRGYGQLGALLVADELRGARMRRVFAPAPETHGIDVYFWIRLGYRPLLRDAWPCERRGVAWLCLDLA